MRTLFTCSLLLLACSEGQLRAVGPDDRAPHPGDADHRAPPPDTGAFGVDEAPAPVTIRPDPDSPDPDSPDPDSPDPDSPETDSAGANTCLTVRSAELCGAWVWTDGVWRARGQVDLLIGAVRHPIFDADLVVTVDPPSIDGRGTTAVPGPWGEEVEPVPVTVGDWSDEDSETSGVEIEGGPGSLGGALGAIGFVGDAFTVAGDGVRFAADSVVGVLDATVLRDVTLILPMGDSEAFSPRGPFLIDGRWISPTIHAHLGVGGEVHLLPFPVIFDGALMIDADADGDGDAAFDDVAGFAIAGEGAVRLGYDLFGHDFSLEVAEAGLFWDRSRSLDLRARGELPDLFADTPLDPFVIDAHAQLYARFAEESFAIRVECAGDLGGVEFADGVVELSEEGIVAQVTVTPIPGVMAAAELNGAITADGMTLTGEAALHTGALSFDGAISLGEDGLAGAARFEVPALGALDLAGAITDRIEWRGRADLRPLGLEMAGAEVQLDDAGLRVSGDVNLAPLGWARVAGEARDDGFSLSGGADLRIAGFTLHEGHLAISEAGAHVRGRLALPHLGDVVVEGALDGEHTTLNGMANLNVAGFHLAGATVRAGGGRVHVAATAHLPLMGSIAVAGDVRPGGFRLTGRGDLSVAGYRLAAADVTLWPGRGAIATTVRFAGHDFALRGGIAPGRFDLRASVEGSAGAGPVDVSGRITLSVSNRGVGASFRGEACFNGVFVRECRGVSADVDSSGRICVDPPVVGEVCVDVL